MYRIIFVINILIVSFISFPLPSYAGNGVSLNGETIFVPIGKSEINDQRILTPTYGIKVFNEITEELRIDYGASFSILNGYLFSFPISLAYVHTGDYKFNLRPRFFAGIEPFVSNFTDFNGFKFYGFTGLGIDYYFDNRWFLDFGAKVYINESFFSGETDKPENHFNFNTGVISMYFGSGYKF